MTPQYIAVAPGQSFQFKAATTTPGSFLWYVNGIQGGNATDGTVSSSGLYTAPASLTISGNVTVTAALAGSGAQNYATSAVALIQPAAVNCPNVTGNPQVAQYGLYLPAPGSITVNFGPTTSYGKSTWAVPTTSANGGTAMVYVAGMLANTTYHMQAQVQLNNGATFTDIDHVCTTGSLPSPMASIQLQPISGTPAPGIQLWNTILPYNQTDAFATDINGNVIWTYSFTGGSGLDLGKLIAFQARQTRPVWDFEDIGDWWTRADASAISPIICVPTTAGTGSEVGRAGVLTNSDTHEKKIIFHHENYAHGRHRGC